MRMHLSSLMAQCFDPCFVLNSVFSCISRLLNRKIVKSFGRPMAMTDKIPPEYCPLVLKVADLFFKLQFLSVTRYALLRDVPLQRRKNMILAFSDGSHQFASSSIYLVSYEEGGLRYQCTLMSTLCKINEVEGKYANLFDSVPKRESHAMYLAASGAVTLARDMKELNIPLEKAFVFADVISHIVALGKSPTKYRPPFNRYYSDTNSLLFSLAEMTGQLKENVIKFIQQRVFHNPAD